MPVSHRHTRNGGIDIIDSGFNALEYGSCRHARGGMALHMYRNRQGLLQLANQLLTHHGFKQPGHILNADGIGTHIFDLAT